MTKDVGTLWQQGSEPIDLFFAETPLMMHSVDREGTLTRVTEPWAALLGRTPDQMIGRLLADFLAPRSRQRALEHVFPLLVKEGTIHNIEYNFLHRDGTPVPVLLSTIAHYDEDGRFHRSLSFIVDNSEAKRAEAQTTREQRLEAIGNLVGGVAHDFNNLLAVVMGNLELLADMPDHPDRANMLRDALDAVQRGATLTQQLVAYGQRAQLAPRAHRLREVLDEISEMLARPLPANIALRLDLAPALPRIMIDRVQLETALFNIVGNACEALDKGGQITISARAIEVDADTPHFGGTAMHPGPYVAITVRDNGPGMPDDVADRAFEPFFTTKPPGSGSGMGLAMVHGFALQSKGAVHLETAPGRGTSITLYLPALRIAADTPAPRAPAIPRRQPVPAPRPVQILLVEDKTEVRRLIATQLRLAGHGVIEASTGDSAMTLIEHGLRPQLLLADLSMPGRLQGHELIELVAQRLPGIRTVLLTGHVVDDANIDGRAARLIKPVSRKSLLNCIAQLMSRGQEVCDATAIAPRGVAAPAPGF